MNTTEIMKNIAQRCGGDIYLGIVGPVRVGKSTFIKEFMDKAVLPYVPDEYEKARMIDELPQAGIGKTIMTTEPKFVPNNAATIEFDDGFKVNVRLVDCVGFVIPEAKGYKDEDGVRMVRTPWSEEPMPFNEAAKLGTQKVIQDHSTIGVVITTDGSISDLSREAYIEAEAEVIDCLLYTSYFFSRKNRSRILCNYSSNASSVFNGVGKYTYSHRRNMGSATTRR